jgi:hypothetical protein
MNDLQEELSSSRIEDEDSTVDRLSSQIAFKGLVNRYTVNVCIVDEKLNLVAEEFGIIL